jgi:hypothetical protein
MLAPRMVLGALMPATRRGSFQLEPIVLVISQKGRHVAGIPALEDKKADLILRRQPWVTGMYWSTLGFHLAAGYRQEPRALNVRKRYRS